MSFTLFLLASLLAGYLMLTAGLSVHLLHRRWPERRCPSCGRLRRDCSCVRDRRS